ncbi:MAG TPA: addiction module toxin RelE [Planctomycetes bacterium]|nr:addiction module toxin RelE [Planctomycetota bacterium]|tara:strand:+ start:124 stop:420 length:297 start_codon:yes stop_codon:yes gene_type:complete
MLGLEIRSRAEADLASAWDYYEEQWPGLGEELLLCVEAAFDMARSAPDWCPVVMGPVRRCLVRRFPYCVYFKVEVERIVVLAVYHSSRDPAGWQDRMT